MFSTILTAAKKCHSHSFQEINSGKSLIIILIGTISLLFSSCREEEQSYPSQNFVRLNLELLDAQANNISTDNFSLSIRKSADNARVSYFDDASNIPETIELESGNYYGEVLKLSSTENSAIYLEVGLRVFGLTTLSRLLIFPLR